MYRLRLFGHVLHHFFKNRELDELYVSIAIKSFAESMATIFVPIFLYQHGFGFKDIAFFYIIAYTMLFLVMPFGMISCKRYGIKKTIFFGILFLIIYYTILNSVANGLPYGIPALIFGISGGLYWAGFHLDFTRSVDHKKEAREFSVLRIIAMVFSSIGPLVGSLFIKNLSYKVTFMIVSFLLIISTLPLFLSSDARISLRKINWKRIAKADRKEKAFSYFGIGFLAAASVIFWPLVMFTVLEEIVSLGAILTGISVMMIAWYYIVGEIADRFLKPTLITGVLTYSPVWISRVLFLTPFGVLINHGIAQFSGALVDVPFVKIMYAEARRSRDKGNYFLFREMFLQFGKLAGFLLVIIFNTYLVLFLLSFAASYLYLTSLKNLKLKL